MSDILSLLKVVLGGPELTLVITSYAISDKPSLIHQRSPITNHINPRYSPLQDRCTIVGYLDLTLHAPTGRALKIVMVLFSPLFSGAVLRRQEAMNTDAMITFRESYRGAVHPRYSGWWHMLSVLGVGLCVMVFSFFQINAITLIELITVPATLLAVNFAEYAAHRWLGHRKTSYGKLFYSRHTGDHHSFFHSTAMGFESVRDWRVVLFPVYLIVVFVLLLTLPLGYVLHGLFAGNVAYLFAISSIGGYLLYEILHFSYHIPVGHWAEKLFLIIPGWRRLRSLHVAHHEREHMQHVNFNITLPIFDILLGTLYRPSRASIPSR